jgi:hypothetical protein
MYTPANVYSLIKKIIIYTKLEIRHSK